MSRFVPKNKSLYMGKMGRMVMGKAGLACDVVGETTFPASQTKERKDLSVLFIKFPNCALTFQVRPCDVIRD